MARSRWALMETTDSNFQRNQKIFPWWGPFQIGRSFIGFFFYLLFHSTPFSGKRIINQHLDILKWFCNFINNLIWDIFLISHSTAWRASKFWYIFDDEKSCCLKRMKSFDYFSHKHELVLFRNYLKFQIKIIPMSERILVHYSGTSSHFQLARRVWRRGEMQ